MAIKLRRGTAFEWAEANPILWPGEPGYETDTGIFKVGDGETRWLSLEPVGPTEYADLDVVGAGKFVILQHDEDASNVPDGTFIARLPSDWTP